MHIVNLKTFRARLKQYLVRTHHEPVVVREGDLPVAVMISPEQYEHFLDLDDLLNVAWIEASAANDDSIRDTDACNAHNGM